jgi:hypothetical protein
MVAFELARHFETAGQNSDAAKWYVLAAERFRRSDWKTKAQEAAVRLGADISAASAESSGDSHRAPAAVAEPQPMLPPEESREASGATSSETEAQTEEVSSQPAEPSAQGGERKRRRRGRRGGRNRRKGETRQESAGASAVRASASPAASAAPSPAEPPEAESPRGTHRRAIPALPLEPSPDFPTASVRGRSGDPGLSSRLSVLEMQLRRLLTCPPAKLHEAGHAPAGPGVLVLTDSDLTSYYYVEPCQTLRVAVANLLRGGAARRGADSIKPRLAEHLGIPESRVAKYLADHCVVRWLQLDEGASHFAHFAIAVLRPVLNE